MKTRAQLIAELKRPELAQVHRFLRKYHPRKAAILEAAGPENVLRFIPNSDVWIEPITAPNTWAEGVYILKHDYQPEPEFIRVLIELIANTRCVCKIPGELSKNGIVFLLARTDFVGFENEIGDVVALDDVRRLARSGRKVYATFIKNSQDG